MRPTRDYQVTEQVSWQDAMGRIDWRQGEHETLIGPTGSGKTELLISRLDDHDYIVFLGTKRIDRTQDRLRKQGYRLIGDAAELNHEVSHRYLFRPPFPKVSAGELKRAHARAFREVLMRAFRQTGWTVAIDELRYVTDFLGLSDEAQLLWLQGRSQGNSVIGGAQRPRFVPLEAYDQATHLYFWRSPDRQSVSRIAEIAGINRRAVLATVPRLERHTVLYVNTVTDDTFITNTRW
jgi:hypothetical protein